MSGFCKYYKQKKQVSYDNGVTWQDVTPYEYQEGDLYERNSTDCGYQVVERWVVVSGDYECSGTTKYTKERKEISYDGGTTWAQTSDYRRGSTVIAYNSEDCGYVPPTDYSAQYLTFVALEDCSFYLSGDNRAEIYYSLDSGTTWTQGSYSVIPTVSAGNKILWKGELLPHSTVGSFSCIGVFVSTGRFNVEGNLSSILKPINFSENTETSSFRFLFRNCNGLINAKNMVFPSSVENDCYLDMFSGCTSLITAPSVLPATTLSSQCYREMFDGCTSLTTAPVLSATTMAEDACRAMFAHCTSLTTAPELPATTLAEKCYLDMFYGCTSLTTAPELPATTLANSCYEYMFAGCTSLTTAPELPATVLSWKDGIYLKGTPGCYRAMFAGCTSLTTAPELPATALVNYCYEYMFQNCTSLTTAPILSATTLESHCYNGMFSGCTNLNNITCLATDKTATNCTSNWVNGVAASGTFTKASSTTWRTGTSGIPDGWTVQDA